MRSITLKEKRSGTSIALKELLKMMMLIWDINIQCDKVMEARRPDSILVDKKAKSCIISGVALPGDCRMREKEIEKMEKY